MVTPLARRRPAKVARETATLDRLSGGRLILGVGLGGTSSPRSFKGGEELDDRARGEMLDEALEILSPAWSGVPVNHRGRHYLVDDVQFLPGRCSGRGYRCGSRPSPETSSRCGAPPVTTASSRSTSRTSTSSRGAVAAVRELRGDNSSQFDVAVELPPGSDLAPYAEAGATWWMTELEPGVSLDEVRGVIREGPAESTGHVRAHTEPEERSSLREARACSSCNEVQCASHDLAQEDGSMHIRGAEVDAARHGRRWSLDAWRLVREARAGVRHRSDRYRVSRDAGRVRLRVRRTNTKTRAKEASWSAFIPRLARMHPGRGAHGVRKRRSVAGGSGSRSQRPNGNDRGPGLLPQCSRSRPA